MRTGEDEAHSPKYAHIELERRWLVDTVRRPALSGLPVTLIEDRYVVGTRLRLRKMVDEASGATSMKFTRKYDVADPLARPIVTAYLDEREYTLLAALPANLVQKRRYKIQNHGQTFSLDVFEGPLAGLELLEIESHSYEALLAISAPDWVVREVSHESRYQGGSLSALGAM